MDTEYCFICDKPIDDGWKKTVEVCEDYGDGLAVYEVSVCGNCLMQYKDGIYKRAQEAFLGI